MWARVNAAAGMLFGCILGLGTNVSLQDNSIPSIASDPSAMIVAQAKFNPWLTFSVAQAGDKAQKRRRARTAAGREAEEKRRKDEIEKRLKGVRRATLPTDCVYNSTASALYSADIYSCGGLYYQRYEENGVTGYEGHGVDVDRGEIEKARAIRAEAEKKRKAEAKKKLEAGRRAALPEDCAYDSYASTSHNTDIYTCRGVRYRKYQEKGVTGYEVVKP